MFGEIDVATHLPQQHPLDPYTGRLVTRQDEAGVKLVAADQHILLDCGFLWDIVANAEAFAPWVKLTPPVPKLGMKANFGLAAGQTLLNVSVPTNKPTLARSYPMCRYWTLALTVEGRKVAYTIGSYRPKSNTMEASWVN